VCVCGVGVFTSYEWWSRRLGRVNERSFQTLADIGELGRHLLAERTALYHMSVSINLRVLYSYEAGSA